MNRYRVIFPLGLLLFCAYGCSTLRQTDPPQTATEQLLVSTSVDRAVSRLNVSLPADARVFLDADNLQSDVVLAKYTVAAVRARLLDQGVHLTNERKDATVIAELRAGAQSIDDKSSLFGIPSFPVPVPFSGVVTFPEIALFKKQTQHGITKLALGFHDADGALIGDTGNQYGQSFLSRYVLLLVSWSDNDIAPPRQDPP